MYSNRDIDKYIELHQYENQRRDSFFSRCSIPIAIITGCFVIINYTLKALVESNKGYDGCLLYFFAFWAMACLVIGGGYFIKALLFNSDYKYVAHLDEQKKYYDECCKDESQHSFDKTKINDNDEFNQWLIKEFINATSFNSRQNDLRSTDLYHANKFLIISFLLLLICSLIGTITTIDNKKDIQCSFSIKTEG